MLAGQLAPLSVGSTTCVCKESVLLTCIKNPIQTVTVWSLFTLVTFLALLRFGFAAATWAQPNLGLSNWKAKKRENHSVNKMSNIHHQFMSVNKSPNSLPSTNSKMVAAYGPRCTLLPHSALDWTHWCTLLPHSALDRTHDASASDISESTHTSYTFDWIEYELVCSYRDLT